MEREVNSVPGIPPPPPLPLKEEGEGNVKFASYCSRLLTPCIKPSLLPPVIFSAERESSHDTWMTCTARPTADLAPVILSWWCPKGTYLGGEAQNWTQHSVEVTHTSLPTSAVREAIPPNMKGFSVLILSCNCKSLRLYSKPCKVLTTAPVHSHSTASQLFHQKHIPRIS